MSRKLLQLVAIATVCALGACAAETTTRTEREVITRSVDGGPPQVISSRSDYVEMRGGQVVAENHTVNGQPVAVGGTR